MDPTDGALYCFVSRDCLKTRLLRFDTNGFCMYYARLSEGGFRWAHSEDGEVTLQIERRQLIWLLDGMTSSSRERPGRSPGRSSSDLEMAFYLRLCEIIWP